MSTKNTLNPLFEPSAPSYERINDIRQPVIPFEIIDDSIPQEVVSYSVEDAAAREAREQSQRVIQKIRYAQSDGEVIRNHEASAVVSAERVALKQSEELRKKISKSNQEDLSFASKPVSQEIHSIDPLTYTAPAPTGYAVGSSGYVIGEYSSMYDPSKPQAAFSAAPYQPAEYKSVYD